MVRFGKRLLINTLVFRLQPPVCSFYIYFVSLLSASHLYSCVLGMGLYPPPCCFYMSESSAMCFSQTCRCVPMRTTINPQPPFHLGVADIYTLGMPHHSRLSSYPFSLQNLPYSFHASRRRRSPLVYVYIYICWICIILSNV